MKIENKTTKEDVQNEKMVLDVTAETWDENKFIAKCLGMDLDKDNNVTYVKCNFTLKNE